MSQHDYNIANQGFPNFRTDLNNALGAIATNNSGSTAPTTTFAHQWWLDTSTTPTTLRQRNADNDAWVTIGTIDQATDTFVPANASSDKISEGNSSVEVVDTGTGYVVVTVDGGEVARFNPDQLVTKAGSASTPAISPTGDLNTGVFFPAADTIAFAEGGAEAMRINSSGQVGIGTNNPANTLVLYGATTPLLQLGNSTTTVGGGSGLQFYITGLDSTIYNQNGGYLRFGTSGSERMRIDSSGDVGIGTTSPQGKFDIESGSYRQGFVFSSTSAPYSGLGQSANWDAYTNNGGAGAREYMGGITVSAYAASTGANTGTIHFGTAISGTKAERARINNGGFFKASNDGTYLSSTGTYHEMRSSEASSVIMYVNSTSTSYAEDGFQVRFARNTTNGTFNALVYYNSGATATKFKVADSGNVTNTNGSYGTISDIKIKQDITDATPQWDDIKNLRFRKYRLKNEVELDPNAKPFLGLIAQEAELVCPGLIEESRDTEEVETTDADGNVVRERRDLGTITKSIKTSILYMKAVKALQEAMTRIEALEAEIATMKAGNGN